MPRRTETEDERVARALQERYRQEFLQRQQHSQRASAPPENVVADEQGFEVPAFRVNSPSSAATNMNMDANANVNANMNIPASAAASVPTLDGNGDVNVHLNFSASKGTNADNGATEQDEELARRLQREMDQEVAAADTNPPAQHSRRTRERRGGPRDAPATNDVDMPSSPASFDDDARLAQELQDAELARRYDRMQQVQIRQEQIQQQQQQQRRQPSAAAEQSSHFMSPPPGLRIQQSQFMDERTSSFGYSDDDDQARRIAQEFQDAEMAQRLSVYEQEAASRRAAMQAQRQQQHRAVWWHRVLPMLCCAVAVLIPTLFVLGVFEDSNVPILGDIDPNDWIETDPFSGNNGTVVDLSTPNGPLPGPGAMAWSGSRRGNGLSLEILNALDDSWQSMYETAIYNWDVGIPELGLDTLTLTTTRVRYEATCSAVTGSMKVCNADYGATRWRGLNEVSVRRVDNTIVSSSAMLNEYYLRRESDDQKLYTVCHELGHGFGLPHWDENFYNRDLGNCMDYTDEPGNNKLPDASNFVYLSYLYGNITSASSAAAATTSSVEGDNDSVAQQQEEKGQGKKKGKKNDRVRRHHRRTTTASTNTNTRRTLAKTNNRHDDDNDNDTTNGYDDADVASSNKRRRRVKGSSGGSRGVSSTNGSNEPQQMQHVDAREDDTSSSSSSSSTTSTSNTRNSHLHESMLRSRVLFLDDDEMDDPSPSSTSSSEQEEQQRRRQYQRVMLVQTEEHEVHYKAHPDGIHATIYQYYLVN